MATTSQHVKEYSLICTECHTSHRRPVDRRHLPGGIRCLCTECDDATPHRFSGTMHDDDKVVAKCGACGEWHGYGSDELRRIFGDGRDDDTEGLGVFEGRCPSCSAFI